MSPPHDEELCSKCGQPGHLALDCRQDQPKEVPRPPIGRKKSSRNLHSRNCNTKPTIVVLGHANHVDAEKAQKDPTIVMGTLPVNSVPASVLFDSGSSHSFISEAFALQDPSG